MPTQAEHDALMATLKARELEKQGIKNPESVTGITPVSTAKASEAPPSLVERAAKVVGDITPVGIGLNALDSIKQQASLVASGGIQSIDDEMRVAAGKAGDLPAAIAKTVSSGDLSMAALSANMQDEAHKTLMAKLRLRATGGEQLADQVETTGTVGKLAAMPGGLFATPLRAGLTGGGMELLDTMTDRMARGEKMNDNYMEYVIRTGVGAGGGVAGYHIGNLTGNFIGYLASKYNKLATKTGLPTVEITRSLTEEAEKMAKANKLVADQATASMKSSGTALNPRGMTRLLNEIDRSFGSTELMPKATPEAWRGYKMLQTRLLDPKPISLENLHALVNTAKELPYDKAGLLKSTTPIAMRDLKALGQITDSVERFISSLTSRRNLITLGGGGRLEQGLKGWKDLTELNKQIFRTDRMMELVANAESTAREGHISFENALQNQFAQLWKNREFVGRIFTKEQIPQIKAIAEGDMSKRFFNRLDRIVGSTLFAPATRLIQSSFGSLFEAEESRFVARQLITNAAGRIAKARVLPEIGAKAVSGYAQAKLAR